MSCTTAFVTVRDDVARSSCRDSGLWGWYMRTGCRSGGSERWRHEMTVRHRWLTRASALLPAVASFGVSVNTAAAQVPNPAADGSMPGAALVGKVLGWLKYGSLAAAIGGMLIGAISVGVGHFGTHG